MKDKQDTNLDLLTRLVHRFCIAHPGGVQVTRDKNRTVWVKAHEQNLGQLIGKRGQHIKALQAVAKRLGQPETLQLESYACNKAYSVDPGGSAYHLLCDVMDAVLGAPPIVQEDEANGPHHYLVYIPRQAINKELQTALDDIFYATSHKDGEYLKFTFLPQ